MTDILTDLDPEQLRRELVRLFAEPKSLHHIVTAGLAGVRRQLTDLCTAIEAAEDGGQQVVNTVAKLANLVRQEQRKHAGAVAQAKRENARAEELAAEVERLRAELADYQLAASEAEGAAARELCGASIGKLSGEGILGPCVRPRHKDGQHEGADGAKWALTIHPTPQPLDFVDLRALAGEQLRQAHLEEAARMDRVLLFGEPAPGLCWCGHDPGAHITDEGDNAVCRACWTADNFHQAHHVHTPAKEN